MTTHKVLEFVGPTHNSDGQESANSYQHRHALTGSTNPFGRAMLQMLKGWEDYAKAHEDRYEAGIGEDYVVGEYWAEIGFAIKRLLDGELGGLDCGSIAHNIVEQIDAQGFKNDGYRLDRKED